jgi:hypothetical protein
MERDDDAASTQADSFLSELVPQVADRLAARHASAYDASAGKARFDTWLTARTGGYSEEGARRISTRHRGPQTSRSRPPTPVMTALMTAAAVIAAAVIIATAGIDGQPKPSALQSSPTSPGTAASQATRPPNETGNKLYIEVTGNHLGTALFSDQMGDAVTKGPTSIPYGTRVHVKCWAPNESGIASINVFYLVETPPWAGDYAPANAFLNPDLTGPLDPQVPECPSA